MYKDIPKYIGNLLYKYFYSAYEPLYFFYKTRTDKEMIDMIEKKLKPGMIALDVGANIGFYTTMFSRLVGPKGKVFSFEPEEENLDHLYKNTKELKNVVVEKKAVGAVSGEISLFKSSFLNVDHQTYDIGESRDSEKIKCIALDDYFNSKIKVDLIKIDIQGYDYYAIKGMKELLKRSEDVMIIGEVSPYGLIKSGSSAGEYMSLLRDIGFEIHFFEYGDEKLFTEHEEDKYFYTDFYAIKKRK